MQRDPSRIPPRAIDAPPREHRGSIPTTEIRYRVVGEGPDVVLAHGLGGLFHSWEALLPLLSRAHRVWEVAFPEFDSETTHRRGGNSVDDYASDLARFFDHTRLDHAVVVGNSLGGQVAATFTREHPRAVDALVLLASSGLGEQREGYSLFPGSAVKRLLKSIDPEVMRAILRTVFEADTYFEAQLPEIRARLSDRRWKLGLLTTARRVRDACILPLFPHIACPTLMIYGDRDRIVPVEYARAAAPLLPHGELQVMEGIGHAPQIERPVETHQSMERFLG